MILWNRYLSQGKSRSGRGGLGVKERLGKAIPYIVKKMRIVSPDEKRDEKKGKRG